MGRRGAGVPVRAAHIFNLTTQEPVLWGTSELSDASKNWSQTRSRIRGEVTVGEAGATFEIQHRCTYYHSSSTDQGFGVALNHGEPNVCYDRVDRAGRLSVLASIRASPASIVPP